MSDQLSSLDRVALRHGLAQVLKCYQASGLRRFNCSTDVQVPADLLAPMTREVMSPPPASAPLIETPQPIGSTNSSTVSEVTPTIVPPATQTSALPLEVNAPAAPGLRWQLPALDDDVRLAKLQALDEQVKACRKCTELVCYRRQTVFGEGHIRPKVCFFGEAPGADEDASGRPFVGAAGRLLTDIIRAMKLTREEVYILNALKCRPPQNRTPLPDEVSNCRPFALTQLEILQPEFIILLGATAVRSVLQSGDSVGRLRGRFHHFHGARVVVTYHPSYLLRTPEAKKHAWADVQMVMRELQLK